MKVSSLLARFDAHPRLVISITVILVLVTVLIGLHTCASPGMRGHYSQSAFVDEETLELTSRPGTDVPPLIGKSGRPTLVHGMYWTCGECKDRQLAYLQKYDDATKHTLEAAIASDPSGKAAAEAFMNAMEGSLVRLPASGSPWVSADSPEGRAVVSSFSCPGGGDPRPCP